MSGDDKDDKLKCVENGEYDAPTTSSETKISFGSILHTAIRNGVAIGTERLLRSFRRVQTTNREETKSDVRGDHLQTTQQRIVESHIAPTVLVRGRRQNRPSMPGAFHVRAPLTALSADAGGEHVFGDEPTSAPDDEDCTFVVGSVSVQDDCASNDSLFLVQNATLVPPITSPCVLRNFPGGVISPNQQLAAKVNLEGNKFCNGNDHRKKDLRLPIGDDHRETASGRRWYRWTVCVAMIVVIALLSTVLTLLFKPSGAKSSESQPEVQPLSDKPNQDTSKGNSSTSCSRASDRKRNRYLGKNQGCAD